MNEYSWSLSLNSDYLVHYGTKGMRWGNRKYQYNDGSLTPAGRERYYRNLHGSNSLVGRLKSGITGKYADGTETYSHYRKRATRAGQASIDADSSGPIASYLGERRMRKYGKGMNARTVNAGKQVYKTERTAQNVKAAGTLATNALSRYATYKVADMTENASAMYGTSVLTQLAGQYATTAIINSKVYGSRKNVQAENDIAAAYERKTSRR